MTERRNQARGSSEWADTYGDIGNAPGVQFRELPLHLLDPWQSANGKPQPFDSYTQEELEELAENIRLNGVIEAICVRPRENGRFQIIAGHHRAKAAGMAGLTKIPAKIEVLDDNQATIRMVDSNLKRRKKIKYSEKAFAYRERMEALKNLREAGCTSCAPPKMDATGAQLVHPTYKGKSRDIIAEEGGESRETVRRYIRLTELFRPLLDLVDNGKLAFVPAVELSYLEKPDQRLLLEVLQGWKCKAPSMAQATLLREQAAHGQLTTEQILTIMVKPKSPKAATVNIPAQRIAAFFPSGTTPEQMEAEIYEALLAYRSNQPPASA